VTRHFLAEFTVADYPVTQLNILRRTLNMSTMDDLPVEILCNICSYFTVEQLENTISKVSRKWEATAEAVITHRAAQLDQTISPEARHGIATDFVPPEPTPVMLLKKYETSTFAQPFKVMKFLRGWR